VVDTTMDGLTWLRNQVEEANTDLLREMLKLFCEPTDGRGSRRELRGSLRRALG
jgi:hypothetical protein